MRAVLLAIAVVRAADVRAFVPVDSEPAQVGEQFVHARIVRARLVRILDAQDEAAARLAGRQEVEQRRARVAQVQQARGARGKACDERRLADPSVVELSSSDARAFVAMRLLRSRRYYRPSQPPSMLQRVDFPARRCSLSP